MTDVERMSVKEICDWLKFKSGKVFEESVLTAIEGKFKLLWWYHSRRMLNVSHLCRE